MTDNKNINIILWLNISLFVLILMVFVGGVTRLTQSGLSMTDWKPITGIFPPTNEEQWISEFNKYKEYPEYQNSDMTMTISEYKTIYFWEYLHRILGRFIGLLFIVPFTYFYLKKYLNKNLFKKLIFVFLLGGFQGFLGWYMVKSGLVNNPYISHYRLFVHLLCAFIIIGLVYWIKLDLLFSKERKIGDFFYFNRLINTAIFLFFMQLMYGAFMAGLKAGKLWNTFPLIEGKIVPNGLFMLEPFYLNFFENNKLIQFIHRYLGLSLMMIVYYISFQLKEIDLKFNLKSKTLVTIVSCQVFLGILTLISEVSIVLAVSHQILAILLMLKLLDLKHSIGWRE